MNQIKLPDDFWQKKKIKTFFSSYFYLLEANLQYCSGFCHTLT